METGHDGGQRADTREKTDGVQRIEVTAEEERDDSLLIVFNKPFVFEKESHTYIDLSGLEDLCAKDMIAANKTMERGGTVNMLPELSLEYACIISARATGRPIEFFEALPPKEAMKLKNRITAFLYGGD